MTVPSGARRNLRLYPWYVAGGSFFAWMPVFFLYFSTHVTLTEVLALEAIYYASVVLLEVPSGYFSDRVGRRPTLIISAAGLVAAYATFGLASSFVALACAQVLLAAGLAFNSGTDTSFHLSTLEELGEADRYADREAKLVSLTFAVGGAAAVAGGAIALLDIRFAYGLSLLGAAVALVAALAFAPVARASDEASASLVDSLRGCVDLAMTPRVGWFFAAAVVATVINHIPYEFYQPYLERLEDTSWDAGTTPLVAGLHLALVQVVAAVSAQGSSTLAARLGPVVLVLAATLLQLALVVGMAWWLSPWVALLLVGRSVPRALQDAPIRAVVAPNVPADLRATYLSLQSLMGRLGFALLLVALSLGANDVARTLQLAAMIAGGLVAALLLASRLAGKGDEQDVPLSSG